jgi:DNA polymerase III delta subunit
VGKKTPQVYLIHGQETQAIQQVRDRVLDGLIPADMRDQNLTEYIAESNKALKLQDIGWDIVSELSTLSFFPDSRRVIIIVDLKDLCGSPGTGRSASKQKTGKGKGKKIEDVASKFANFLETSLLQTPNAIVFINYERDMDTTVSRTSRLYKTIQKIGFVQECKGENKTFALEDALRDRDAAKAIHLFREISGKRGGVNPVFSSLFRVTHLLLQACTVDAKRRAGATDESLKKLFPADKSGIFGQHEFVQKKVMGAARRFRVADLAEALKELLAINRLVIPVSTDVYVRDFSLAVELWILKWYSRKESRGTGY